MTEQSKMKHFNTSSLAKQPSPLGNDRPEENTKKTMRAMWKEVREAALAIAVDIPLGDKALDRALDAGWTAEHVRRLGARPSARSVRRWKTDIRNGQALPARTLPAQGSDLATALPRRDTEVGAEEPGSGLSETAAAAVPPARKWLPAPGECVYIDGARITAAPVQGAAPFFVIASCGARPGNAMGSLIAAEATLRTMVQGQVATSTSADTGVTIVRRHKRRGADAPCGSWRRLRRRTSAAVAQPLTIGERVIVAGRRRIFLGRTVGGRLAFADLATTTPSSGRRAVSIFDASILVVRDTAQTES